MAGCKRCEVPARVSVGVLVATGVMVLYMLRVNLSVAIVAMVRTPSSSPSDSENYTICGKFNGTGTHLTNLSTPVDDVIINSTFLEEIHCETEMTDQLLLTGAQKGMVLGAFFYGYIITSIPGGRLAELYGTKIVFGGSVLVGGILTLFTPLAAKYNYIVLIIIRILIGIAQGVVYPSMHVLVARWIPPLERPRFIAVTYMANCLGTILTLSFCGVIIDYLGWEATFYICGGLAFVWVVLWFFLMFDSPKDHPRISDQEKRYIMEAIGAGTTQQKPNKTPWKSILISLPVWATNVAHIGSMFGFTLLITQLPTYMNSVLKFSIKNNGFLSSLPFLAQFLGSTLLAFIGDFLLTRNIITVATSRRVISTVSLLCSGAALVAVGYVGLNPVLAVILFPISAACLGGMCAGHLANHLDLAPNFAGTLMGLCNTVAFSVSMLAPIIVGALTPDQTLQQWQTVFWITGSVQAVCWLFFMIFSKFKIQPWNYHVGDSSLKTPEEGKSFLKDTEKPKVVESNGKAVDNGA